MGDVPDLNWSDNTFQSVTDGKMESKPDTPASFNEVKRTKYLSYNGPQAVCGGRHSDSRAYHFTVFSNI